MHVRDLSPELVQGMLATPVPTSAEQDHIEVRLLSIFVTLSFVNDLAGPIAYVFQISPSMLFKVATMAHGHHLIGILFTTALVLLLPHALALLFLPEKLAHRLPRKLATLSAVIAAMTWAYLAILAMPLDTGAPLFGLYLRESAVSFGLAFLYAVSLNSQLLRLLHKATR